MKFHHEEDKNCYEVELLEGNRGPSFNFIITEGLVKKNPMIMTLLQEEPAFEGVYAIGIKNC